jgi:peptidoglycan/xylan/chitin deacetylase (PgdA/CDA1 family)
MFHHFHDDAHPVGQGSLSAREFEAVIDWLLAPYRILNANEYVEKLEKKTLENTDICLSFDDALRCQFDIALPILEKRKIKAFFFVYSSPLLGDPDPLEVYRYFRTTSFPTVDDFYNDFFSEVKFEHPSEYEAAALMYDDKIYLSEFPFYTSKDKWFRYLRDMVLGANKYNSLMKSLMAKHEFVAEEVLGKLWINSSQVKKIYELGHVVGLHSHSHPTTIHKLKREDQRLEYETNYKCLKSILGASPIAMSHPCGNYNDDTLDILTELGIRVGFRSNNSIKEIRSNLEIPREDHSNIFRAMKS